MEGGAVVRIVYHHLRKREERCRWFLVQYRWSYTTIRTLYLSSQRGSLLSSPCDFFIRGWNGGKWPQISKMTSFIWRTYFRGHLGLNFYSMCYMCVYSNGHWNENTANWINKYHIEFICLRFWNFTLTMQCTNMIKYKHTNQISDDLWSKYTLLKEKN